MNKKGFTLVELMVVMAIIAILATAGISQYGSFIRNARDTTRITDLKSIETIIASEMASVGLAPTNILVSPNSGKGILSTKALKDFKDPLDTVNNCYSNGATKVVCQYQYAQCDAGRGYILRTTFEDTSKVTKYALDEGRLTGGAESTPNSKNPQFYDIGNCSAYPVDSAFVKIK